MLTIIVCLRRCLVCFRQRVQICTVGVGKLCKAWYNFPHVVWHELDCAVSSRQGSKYGMASLQHRDTPCHQMKQAVDLGKCEHQLNAPMQRGQVHHITNVANLQVSEVQKKQELFMLYA